MTAQLDLFADPTPAPVAVPLTELQAALLDFSRAVRIQREDLGIRLLASPWTPDEKRCARLVNLINRGVASDRPALSLESVQEALPHVPRWCMGRTHLVEEAIR